MEPPATAAARVGAHPVPAVQDVEPHDRDHLLVAGAPASSTDAGVEVDRVGGAGDGQVRAEAPDMPVEPVLPAGRRKPGRATRAARRAASTCQTVACLANSSRQ
jgi:hypothetical protein